MAKTIVEIRNEIDVRILELEVELHRLKATRATLNGRPSPLQAAGRRSRDRAGVASPKGRVRFPDA